MTHNMRSSADMRMVSAMWRRGHAKVQKPHTKRLGKSSRPKIKGVLKIDHLQMTCKGATRE